MKRFVCMLLILCCLMASMPVFAGAKTSLLVVTNCDSWVSLRASDSTRARRLEKLPKGAYVDYINNAENGFAYVLYNGTYGYVLKAYLERPSAAARISNCWEFVSFRVFPNTHAPRICKIPLGRICVKQCDTANGFARVYYNGQYGYVLDRYLQPIDKASGVRRWVVNCEAFISLRSEPSTKSSRLAKIPLNQQIHAAIDHSVLLAIIRLKEQHKLFMPIVERPFFANGIMKYCHQVADGRRNIVSHKSSPHSKYFHGSLLILPKNREFHGSGTASPGQ